MDKYQTLREKDNPSNNVYPNIKTQNIPDSGITTPKIADDAITFAKLQDGSVDTTKIANEAVTASKIDDGAVTTPKIADGNVTGQKLADGTITRNKIAFGVLISVYEDTIEDILTSAITTFDDATTALLHALESRKLLMFKYMPSSTHIVQLHLEVEENTKFEFWMPDGTALASATNQSTFESFMTDYAGDIVIQWAE